MVDELKKEKSIRTPVMLSREPADSGISISSTLHFFR